MPPIPGSFATFWPPDPVASPARRVPLVVDVHAGLPRQRRRRGASRPGGPRDHPAPIVIVGVLAANGVTARLAYDGSYGDTTRNHAASLKVSVPF